MIRGRPVDVSLSFGDLALRALGAVLLLAIAGVCFYLGGYVLMAFVVAVLGLGLRELVVLARSGVGGPLFLPACAMFTAVLVLAALTVVQMQQTGLGMVHLTLCCVAVVAAEGAAQLGDRMARGSLMCPALSGLRTWAGAMAGWIAGLVAVAGVAAYCGITIIHALPLAVVSVLASQLGKLFAGWLRQEADLVDGSQPGWASVLSSVDGLSFGLLAVVVLLVWAGG